MTSARTPGAIGRASYDEAFPRVSDAVTIYVWRTPGFYLTRAAAAAKMPAAGVILVEVLLAAVVFSLFLNGRYWLGLIAAVGVSLLRVVALMLSRLGHSHGWANHARVAVEIVIPLLWWWAWEHGLVAYGRPFHPVYATMVLWVVVGGTIAVRVIEGLTLHRFNGMQIHKWRPFDSRFRLASAGRNANLIILASALLFGRPHTGIVLVAWWVLVSLIVHSVRFAQLTEEQARRVKIVSWLDE